MSWTPSESAIRSTPSLEQEISEAVSAQEVQAILKRHALGQNLVTEDRYDPNVLLPVPAGDAARAQGRLAKTIHVNGKVYVAEGNSEHELAQAETDIYRKLFTPDAATEPARDEATGRFVVEVPVERSDADRVTDEIIERSLRERGVNIKDLQDFTNQKLATSWADATEEFKQTVGSWWIGGQENVQKMGDVLLEMGAADNPSVENLRRAAEYLRDNNLLVENPETTAIDAIRQETDPYKLRAMLQGNRGINR